LLAELVRQLAPIRDRERGCCRFEKRASRCASAGLADWELALTTGQFRGMRLLAA